MPFGDSFEEEVAKFLLGDPPTVARISESVDLAVRSFQIGDAASNKDLTQEALTRVFVSLSAGQFRGESSLRTYAGRVARYTCLEHLRHRRLEVGLDAESLPSKDRWSEPELTLLGTEEHLRNLEILSRLPYACRELLRLVFVEKLSYKEVGLRLGISENAIKTRVHRCRAVCRQVAGLRKRTPEQRAHRKARS